MAPTYQKIFQKILLGNAAPIGTLRCSALLIKWDKESSMRLTNNYNFRNLNSLKFSIKLLSFWMILMINKSPHPCILVVSKCLTLNSLFIVLFITQTHKKKTHPHRTESTASDDGVLALVEPPPFGTYHAVCTFMC